MSREQDLLFCKIAIQSGKVTQEVAQKCLAIANRVESEGKQRPLVGALFLRQNILSSEDVQKIYGAVQKRMQAQAPSAVNASSAASAASTSQRRTVRQADQVARAPAAGSKAAKPGARGGAPAAPVQPRVLRVTRKPVSEKIDPTLLWSGICFGLVILICIVAMFVLLLKKPKEEVAPTVNKGVPPPPVASTPQTPAPKAADMKALLEKVMKPGAQKKEESPPGKAEAPPGEGPEKEKAAPAEGEGKTEEKEPGNKEEPKAASPDNPLAPSSDDAGATPEGEKKAETSPSEPDPKKGTGVE